ncbi:MAG TPA: lytic murein transglycosylase [Sphingomonadaceae bacterium]|nr:lytic murein transglycosylase [Sphingomonadaceae bacterium]
MRRILLGLALLAASAAVTAVPACAQIAAPTESGFQTYLQTLRGQAERAGISGRTIAAVFPTLTLSQRVIELDRAQPGGSSNPNAIPAFAPYERRHVNPELIARGRTRYQGLRAGLADVERRYGVTPSVIMAIYGHETSYGAVTGDFDLANSLATLAYEGRRRQLFADEFIATLRLMDRGYPRSQLKGSWAGATGYPQFLPSMFLRLGVDGDGDGRSDIWRSQADALASIGNYLNNAGWKPRVPWGIRVAVPATLNRAAVGNATNSPRCPRVHDRHSRWLTMREWRALGVVPTGGGYLPDTELASLLEPDGSNARAFLLTTNYRAILDYNCSNFYALSVGLLADEIAR